MTNQNNLINNTENLWAKELFKANKPVFLEHKSKKTIKHLNSKKIVATSDVWITSLFKGYSVNLASNDRMSVLKDGVVVQEIMLDILAPSTFIGRHPGADIQLEYYKLEK